MIKIGDTGLLEGLPPGIAEQHWVKVIDAVYRERLKKELKVIERIHVYTAIDSLPEDLLDVLAVQFKVDWYRDDYPVETKRRVIKTAMEVRRYCGTEWAVKQAISAIYPNSEIVEWYDYSGTPGHWRLRVNITENTDISYYTIKRMEDLLGYARRCTAHLEGISYLIFNDTTTAYVGAGYHGTTQRVCPSLAPCAPVNCCPRPTQRRECGAPGSRNRRRSSESCCRRTTRLPHTPRWAALLYGCR